MTCVYDGPTYDGYACDFDGNFWVTVTDCTASYVYVDWGDGGTTNWEGLPPGQLVYHTYDVPGIYYVYMSAEFSPDDCQYDTYAEFTFVFEYPSAHS